MRTKRILAMVLSAVMILSLLPTNLVFAAELVQSELAKSQDGAFLLYTSDDLKVFADYVNGGEYDAGAILMSNITYEGTSSIGTADIARKDYDEGYTVSNIKGYSGVFDGNGYTITMPTDMYLFGAIDGATVKHLTVSGGNKAIAAYMASGTMLLCNNKSTISGWAYCGGIADIVGAESSTSTSDAACVIRGCTNYGNLNVNWNVGGIVGAAKGKNVLIDSCANYGNFNLGTGRYVGGIAGKLADGATVSYCFDSSKRTNVFLGDYGIAYLSNSTISNSFHVNGGTQTGATKVIGMSDDVLSVLNQNPDGIMWSADGILPIKGVITFDANGGSGEMDTVTATYGDKYQLPTECAFTAPEGMKFNGWAERPNGDVLTWGQYEITGDKTFYAVWEPNTHISFELFNVYSTGATGYRFNEKITRYWKNGDSSNFTGSENDYNMKIEWSKRNGKDVATISLKGVDIQTSSNCLLVLGHSELEIDIIVEDDSTLGSISVYDSDVNISGGGKLTINDPNVDSQNIYVSGNLMVDGAEIYADSLSEKAVNVIFASGDMEITNGSKIDISSASDIADSNYAALRANGKMTISENSDVSVICTEAATCYAVMSGNDFVVEDSIVKIENAGTNRAISAGGNISVTQTTGTTKVSASANGIAMAAANGKVTVNGGTVELISSANNALRVLNGIEIKGASDVTIKGGTGKKAIRFDGADGLTVGEDLTTVASTDRSGANLTLYAVEIKDYYQYIQVGDIPSYSVTLEANGGTINGGNIESYTKGVRVELPTDVTKDGYTFVGWYANSDFSGDRTAEIAATENGDKKYYAKWAANISEMEKNGAYKVVHYKETTDGSYAEVTEDTQFPLYAKIGTPISAEAKTYEGYALNNEKTVASATLAEPKVENGELVITTLAFYYDLNEYTITFDTDGGSAVEAITQKCTTAITAPENPTKEGYIFSGWDKEIPTTMPAENVTVTALWKKTIGTEIPLAAPVKNTAPQTIIETDEYTATIVWSPEVTDRFAYNTVYTATITITPKENYTVAGIAENGYKVAGSEGVTNEADSGIVTVTYAKTGSRPSSGGGVSRYTVKFDTNGGTKIANKTVTRNSKLAEPTAPTMDGYSFIGWFTDEELREKYDFDSKVTKGFTLYAKWAKHDDETKEPDDNAGSHSCPSKEFGDLDVNAWYHLDTDYVIENGIFKGITEEIFEPNSAQTRAMMVTVLYRLEGEPEMKNAQWFEDVEKGQWYSDAVAWATFNGITMGYGDGNFGPDDYITREQIATIMYRYAQYKGYDITQGGMLVREFDDYEEISEYALTAMTWAVNSGLISGRGNNNLAPADNATRAEIAAILHRFIEANK